MEKRLNRIFTIAMLFVFAATLSIFAGAEDTTVYSSGELNYTLSEDMTATITGFSGEETQSLVIPETIDGYAVKAIGKKAFYSSKITSLTLPEGLERLESGAFAYCKGLTEITIPQSLVFATPSTATTTAAFKDCKNIETVTFKGCRKTIPDNICYGLTGLEKIVWPEGVTEIDSNAFYDCDGLRTLEIPDGVTTLGSGAFSDCDGLTEIIIPESVNIVDGTKGPFQLCSNLKRVVFEGTRSVIPAYICRQVTNLEEIVWPEGITEIGAFAFSGCKGLKALNIPETVTTLGSDSFGDCDGLTEIIIPESVNIVDGTKGPFQLCSNLKRVVFEGTRSVIPAYICHQVTNLEEIVWPEGVTEVGSHAFAYCNGLRTLEIPDSVTTLGSGAFYNCDGLTEIIIPHSVINVSTSTAPFEFSNKVKTVILKGKRTEIPAYLFHQLPGLERIEGGDGFEGLEGLESIGSQAFSYCENLKSFKCPSTLKYIGKSSFSHCTALTDFDFANVEKIANNAFWACTALTTVTLPKTLQDNKEVITQGPFYGCSGITSMIFEGTTIPTRFCNNVKSLYAVDMINGLEYTGSSAFTGTDVGVFVIRNKVCSIPDSENSIPDTAEIYSYSGSTAEAYAKKYNRVFHPLETMNNVDGAARYIRERMLQKDNYIIFNADLSIEKAGFRTLMNKVFEYDPKNPETGDYLRWNISSYHPTVTETDGKLFYTIEVNYFTTKEQDEELNTVIPEIITNLGDNDYEKIHSIFELLCDNSKEGVSYKSGKDIYHSAYSVLVNKTGNCQGLALAFNRLALEAGLESRIVVNTAMEHAWNIVKLEGEWYYIDVTFAKDDQENESLYFLRSALTMMTGDGEITYLPEYEEDYDATENELSRRRTPFSKSDYTIAGDNYCAAGECNHVYSLISIEGYSCKGNAYALFSCEKCNSDIIKRKLPKTEHIDENDDTKCDVCKANCCRHDLKFRVTTPRYEASCTEDGYTESEICSRCGYSFKESTVIRSEGHVDSDSDGVCDICGKRTSFIKTLTDRFMKLLSKISKAISKLFGKKK